MEGGISPNFQNRSQFLTFFASQLSCKNNTALNLNLLLELQPADYDDTFFGWVLILDIKKVRLACFVNLGSHFKQTCLFTSQKDKIHPQK